MAEQLNEMVQIIENNEAEKKDAQAKVQFSRAGYFCSQEDFLNKLCIELNTFHVFGKDFAVCDTHKNEPFLHLRIICKGIKREKIKEFVDILQACNLDVTKCQKPDRINTAPVMMDNSHYYFVMVTGVKKNERFQSPTSKLSEFADPAAIAALQKFAEENGPKNVCCTIA